MRSGRICSMLASVEGVNIDLDIVAEHLALRSAFLHDAGDKRPGEFGVELRSATTGLRVAVVAMAMGRPPDQHWAKSSLEAAILNAYHGSPSLIRRTQGPLK